MAQRWNGTDELRARTHDRQFLYGSVEADESGYLSAQSRCIELGFDRHGFRWTGEYPRDDHGGRKRKFLQRELHPESVRYQREFVCALRGQGRGNPHYGGLMMRTGNGPGVREAWACDIPRGAFWREP